MLETTEPQAPGFFHDPIEPHAGLLTIPSDDQRLYKMMSVENLLRSITDAYLYFNRVDSYTDFPGADQHDGEQLPQDRPGNACSIFEKAPDYTAADYFNTSRARTYACCFSLENSDFIWNNYATNNKRGKVCVEFDFAKLRARLNQTLASENAGLIYNGERCRQIFDINYGIINYIDWAAHQSNTEYLANPIQYTFLKDKKYSEERELRVALSALGMGQFALADGTKLVFPPSLQMAFDFRAAFSDGTITQLHTGLDCDVDFFNTELQKLQIECA